jgi:hypothetical protein
MKLPTLPIQTYTFVKMLIHHDFRKGSSGKGTVKNTCEASESIDATN